VKKWSNFIWDKMYFFIQKKKSKKIILEDLYNIKYKI
jgi:hypothetical protein